MSSMLTLVLVLAMGQQTVPGSTPNTVRLAEGAARPAAKIADVAWLTGVWAGEGLGGSVDEVWSAPAAGAMVGHVRSVRDGKAIFYEIMTIIEHEGSLEMRLKHVNPDMTGWEEKANFVTFKLAKLEPGAIYFNGLTFRKVNDDLVEGYLALRDRASGAVREEKFIYRRVKTP